MTWLSIYCRCCWIVVSGDGVRYWPPRQGFVICDVGGCAWFARAQGKLGHTLFLHLTRGVYSTPGQGRGTGHLRRGHADRGHGAGGRWRAGGADAAGGIEEERGELGAVAGSLSAPVVRAIVAL